MSAARGLGGGIGAVLLAGAGTVMAQTAPTAATLPLEQQTATESPSEVRSQFSIDAMYRANRFILMDRERRIWLSPGARAHIDGLFFIGDGIVTNGDDGQPVDVRNTVLIRRMRLEMGMGVLDRFVAFGSVELGTPTPLQNSLIAGQPPQLQTAWFNARAFPLLQGMAGQINTPFTMENRTSSNLFDTLELPLMTRAFAVAPSRQVGAMVWGADHGRVLDYNVGVFTGDGPSRINRDNAWDLFARASVRPFMLHGGLLKDVHVGGSVHYGWRGPTVDYLYSPMTTPAGFQFFRTAFDDAVIVPDRAQFAVAGEVLVPIGRFDIRAEAVYQSNGTREMPPPMLVDTPLRTGRIKGWGFYVQAAYWPLGDVRVNGWPNTGHRPPGLDRVRWEPAPLPRGLQVVLLFEGLLFDYAPASESGTLSPEAAQRDGDYRVWGLLGVVNYWATRHMRLSLSYEQFFMGSAPNGAVLTHEDNHALGPRNAERAVGTYGELMTRVAMQF
jgi:hypothetical protein